MIPQIIHQTSPSGQLSWEEKRLAHRLRQLCPRWQYRLWNDFDNGWMVQKYFPQFAERYEAIKFGVAKADIARYVYMHVYGGFYVDTDYKLLKPFDDDILSSACVIPLEYPTPLGVSDDRRYLSLGNAIFGSQAGHPFWRELITHIFEVNKPERVSERHGIIPATGPRAVSHFFTDRPDEFGDIALPSSDLFYPTFTWISGRSSQSDRAYGIHLNWGSWHQRSLPTAVKAFARRKLNGFLS